MAGRTSTSGGRAARVYCSTQYGRTDVVLDSIVLGSAASFTVRCYSAWHLPASTNRQTSSVKRLRALRAKIEEKRRAEFAKIEEDRAIKYDQESRRREGY
jgi:hypothetical protein